MRSVILWDFSNVVDAFPLFVPCSPDDFKNKDYDCNDDIPNFMAALPGFLEMFLTP